MLSSRISRPERQVVFQFLYGVLAVSSLLGPGMSMGYSSVALPLLKNSTSELNLNESESTWFASIAMISTPVGCIVSLFTMKAGRRAAISSAGIVCSIGWILIATSYTVTQLLIGRFVTVYDIQDVLELVPRMRVWRFKSHWIDGLLLVLGYPVYFLKYAIPCISSYLNVHIINCGSGFATGLASTPACVYLAEISIPRYTAMLTTCSSLFISIGLMFIYFLGFVIKEDWRIVAAVSVVIPALSAMLTLAVLPESPRWLLAKGRENDARKSLLRLRSLDNETERFRDEFNALMRYAEPKYEMEMAIGESNALPIVDNKNGGKIEKREKSGGRNDLAISIRIKEFAKTLGIPEVWKPLIILNVFFFFQQFCGIYVLMAYAVDLIVKAGVTSDPFLITAIIGLVQIIGALCLVLSSFRLGRRIVALISGSGMTISLAGLGIYNQFFDYTKISEIPLFCLFVFVALGSFGFLALPWAMIGELFPTRYVNVLGPATTFLAGLYNFATIQLYPSLSELGPVVMIYFYCAISLLSTIFVFFALPETHRKSKEEIEQGFRKKP